MSWIFQVPVGHTDFECRDLLSFQVIRFSLFCVLTVSNQIDVQALLNKCVCYFFVVFTMISRFFKIIRRLLGNKGLNQYN